jgi:hypothetical protein
MVKEYLGIYQTVSKEKENMQSSFAKLMGNETWNSAVNEGSIFYKVNEDLK